MRRGRTPHLSLDLLRGFRAAAKHLSFTRAAEELFLTQPAISREIKTLEEQLGRPLFRRVNRNLELTSAGRELFEVAEATLSQLDSAIERIAGSGELLAVTTTPAFASLWLAPRLPRFNLTHPGVDVRVIASNDRPDLERDQLDIAIRFVAAGSDAPDSKRLFECLCFPMCSPSLAGDKRYPIRTPHDLAHHVRLDYESIRDGRRTAEWEFWLDAFGIASVRPASTLHFPQYDQLVVAAMEGSGVAIGVLPHVLQHVRDGVLCAPFGPESAVPRGSFFISIRRESAGREAVDAFVGWLTAEVEREGIIGVPTPMRSKAAGRPSK